MFRIPETLIIAQVNVSTHLPACVCDQNNRLVQIKPSRQTASQLTNTQTIGYIERQQHNTGSCMVLYIVLGYYDVSVCGDGQIELSFRSRHSLMSENSLSLLWLSVSMVNHQTMSHCPRSIIDSMLCLFCCVLFLLFFFFHRPINVIVLATQTLSSANQPSSSGRRRHDVVCMAHIQGIIHKAHTLMCWSFGFSVVVSHMSPITGKHELERIRLAPNAHEPNAEHTQ